jgi:hypothetical protein
MVQGVTIIFYRSVNIGASSRWSSQPSHLLHERLFFEWFSIRVNPLCNKAILMITTWAWCLRSLCRARNTISQEHDYWAITQQINPVISEVDCFTFTHNNTVPSTMQIYLLFPFYNMFRPQPPIIRPLNLSKILYYIECHSFTSHVTAIFHDFKCCIHNLANIS